jgi:hypothetical protein
MVHPVLADSPPRFRGRFAWSLRTVRLVHCRLPKSFAFCVVLPLWVKLGLVPRVGRSVVTM